jgi:hypothetical protein
MSDLNFQSPYLRELRFTSKLGKEIAVVLGEDRSQACVVAKEHFMVRKGSTARKLILAVLPEHRADVWVFTPEEAVAFVTAYLDHYDSDVTQDEIAGYRESLLGGAHYAEDRQAVGEVFALLEAARYKDALVCWRKLDTAVRESFPSRLQLFLQEKAQPED